MNGERDDRDAALFDRLRAADPGAALPPADPTRVDRLLEDVMNDTVSDTDARGEARTATRTRSPLTWLAAAAAVVLVGVAGTLVLGGEDPAPPSTTATAEPTVTELSLNGGAAGRCMPPSPEVLGGAAAALDAEVTAVADGRATLTPLTWYAGEETDVVVVAAGSADLAALIGAPQFEEGQRYLVAADEAGTVMVCGFSGPYDEQLADLYAEAFGR